MICHKLEELIKNALKGQNLGNNTVVVRTTMLGEVFIEDFEDSVEERVTELEERIKELEETIDELEE